MIFNNKSRIWYFKVMLDIILCGAYIGFVAALIYCQVLGINDSDCSWKPLLAFTVAGVLIASLLPKSLVAPVRDLSLATFTAIIGYKILSHESQDEYQKNDRFLGWVLIALAVLLVSEVFFNF